MQRVIDLSERFRPKIERSDGVPFRSDPFRSPFRANMLINERNDCPHLYLLSLILVDNFKITNLKLILKLPYNFVILQKYKIIVVHCTPVVQNFDDPCEKFRSCSKFCGIFQKLRKVPIRFETLMTFRKVPGRVVQICDSFRILRRCQNFIL